MPEIPNDLIVYHYPFSPYARKVIWYLTLRKIPYAQCMQPPVLPRPDLESLNVAYRRIPLLSHGRDIYCDTRLILRKLEAAFPESSSPDSQLQSSSDPAHLALSRLFERWTSDAGVFARSTQLLPVDLPTMKDPKFQKDREGFSGRKGGWDRERILAARPEALVHIRDAFELLESTIFSDGREWIFGTAGPSLGDIEAIWPLHWLTTMPGALPPSIFSTTQFPKVFAWILRFQDAVSTAKKSGPKPVTVKGPEMVSYMQSARLIESVGEVDVQDPLELKAGEEVEVWPTDTGFTHRDRGVLLSLTPSEVVIGKKTKVGMKEIHVHMPRWGFRIAKIKGAKL